jgi:iron complex transport system substrate-binding protein
VSKVGDAKLVEVTYPFQGATEGYKYLLVEKGKEIPGHTEDIKVIQIPLERIVCTSTTHIPMLDYLGETNRLVGFPTLDYVSSARMRARIDSGKVTDLGVDKGLNMERLVLLKPDMVMGYLLSGDYGQFKKMEELGVNVVLNAEYLEKHPLGRAEWIKYVALFFSKENEADSIFATIEQEYNHTKQLVESVSSHPTVMSGVVYGDAWFLPGGKNYAARLLRDAGCTYLWEDDDSNGFLQLSFESVYEQAYDADFWIGVASYNSLKEIKDADQRYSKFRPFKEGNIYTYNARVGAKGGNEYLELGYLRPDIILKDLVKISHPELLPSYELYFHRKLQ